MQSKLSHFTKVLKFRNKLLHTSEPVVYMQQISQQYGLLHVHAVRGFPFYKILQYEINCLFLYST